MTAKPVINATFITRKIRTRITCPFNKTTETVDGCQQCIYYEGRNLSHIFCSYGFKEVKP